MERSFGSVQESDVMLSNLFKVSSSFSLPRVDSEVQFQDFLKKVPSTTNLLSGCPDFPAEPSVSEAPTGVPRVPSLDFIRAFLNASRPPGDPAQQSFGSAGPNFDLAGSAALEMGRGRLLGVGTAAGAAGPATGSADSSQEEDADDPCSPSTAQGALALAALPTLAAVAAFPGTLPITALNAGGGAAAPQAPLLTPALAAALMGGQLAGALPGLPAVYAAAAANAAAQAQAHPAPAPGSSTGPTPRGRRAAAAAPAATATGSEGGQDATSEPQSGNHEPVSKQEMRRARRMLSNRESARRSRKRKQEHLAELEQQISMLEASRAELAQQLARAQDTLRAQDLKVATLKEQNAHLLQQQEAAAAAAAAAATKGAEHSSPAAKRAKHTRHSTAAAAASEPAEHAGASAKKH